MYGRFLYLEIPMCAKGWADLLVWIDALFGKFQRIFKTRQKGMREGTEKQLRGASGILDKAGKSIGAIELDFGARISEIYQPLVFSKFSAYF